MSQYPDCKTCGYIMTAYDKGNGEKYVGCYRCQQTEKDCTCKPIEK